ncbi:hypothetical protein V8G54_026905 [Vigna mungo]|uniref:Uncharacterized protein n=1 Tax=Vigna mungo TaxID=3915 RepID=A0AAQ3N172_VIGMU
MTARKTVRNKQIIKSTGRKLCKFSPCLLVDSDGVGAPARGKKTPVPPLEPGPSRNKARMPAPCCGPGRGGRALRTFPFLGSYVCPRFFRRGAGVCLADTATWSCFTPDSC